MVFKHSHSSHLPLILSGRNPNDRSPTSFLEKVPNHTAKDRGWDDPRQFKTKNDQIWMRSLFGLFGRQSRSMTKKLDPSRHGYGWTLYQQLCRALDCWDFNDQLDKVSQTVHESRMEIYHHISNISVLVESCNLLTVASPILSHIMFVTRMSCHCPKSDLVSSQLFLAHSFQNLFPATVSQHSCGFG